MTDQMNVEGLSIAPGVMETIISVAASEVDGVASLGSFATSGIRSMLASKPSTSGIETKMDEDGKLSVAVHVEVYCCPSWRPSCAPPSPRRWPPRPAWRCPRWTCTSTAFSSRRRWRAVWLRESMSAPAIA